MRERWHLAAGSTQLLGSCDLCGSAATRLFKYYISEREFSFEVGDVAGPPGPPSDGGTEGILAVRNMLMGPHSCRNFRRLFAVRLAVTNPVVELRGFSA